MGRVTNSGERNKTQKTREGLMADGADTNREPQGGMQTFRNIDTKGIMTGEKSY